MRVFENLEPKSVFYYFEDICRIPHGSGNMEQISNYCVDFAKEHHLRYRQDEHFNVVIWKDPTPGYEAAKPVILQGHLDMVAVKDADCTLDLEKDGLDIAIDGDWVYAKKTSLGGDDGIAVAYALAILAADDIPHPPLEAVFTVNEEIGLLGAASIDASDLKGKYLLNMDSEDDGIFLISCAGGATVECKLPAPEEMASGIVYEWCISGLQGGHSGMAIHKGLANANVLFGRFLKESADKVPFRAGNMLGGEKDNAIADTCKAILVVAEENVSALEASVEDFEKVLQKEFEQTEPGLQITLTRKTENAVSVLRETAQKSFTELLVRLPYGVQKMMPDMPDKVQTSLNLGILFMKDGEISLSYSVRSSVAAEKEALIDRMVQLTQEIGGHCDISGVYPAWEYNPDSKIRECIVSAYEDITGDKPILEAIHAGVECGIFCEKLPGLDCVSYGPQMNDIHTTRERLNISSVEKNWKLTLEVLKRMNENF